MSVDVVVFESANTHTPSFTQSHAVSFLLSLFLSIHLTRSCTGSASIANNTQSQTTHTHTCPTNGQKHKVHKSTKHTFTVLGILGSRCEAGQASQQCNNNKQPLHLLCVCVCVVKGCVKKKAANAKSEASEKFSERSCRKTGPDFLPRQLRGSEKVSVNNKRRSGEE